MIKHRGFHPVCLGQIIISPSGREARPHPRATLCRSQSRRQACRCGLWEALWLYFGDALERGQSGCGASSWLFGREVIAAEDPFDPESDAAAN